MPVFVWFRYIAPHPGSNDSSNGSEDESAFPKTHSDSYLLMHPVYSKDYLESIYPRHKTPTKVCVFPILMASKLMQAPRWCAIQPKNKS